MHSVKGDDVNRLDGEQREIYLFSAGVNYQYYR